MLHDPALLQRVPAWLLPTPSVDRDPLAMLLSAACVATAIAYLAASLAGVSARVRAGLLALGAFLVVLVPSAGLIAVGAATARPLGQDGGVVQLPLALEKILAGQSPYGADYSDSILGKQARVSDFWTPLGGNPILRHHAYLPGTHLVYLPPWMLARWATSTGGAVSADAARRVFDPRYVNLLFWIAAALLAAGLVAGDGARLAAAACVLVNPLVWWHQVFGANDVLVMAMILGAVHLGLRDRPLLGAALLGFACGTKQLAWPFAPFLLAWLSGATDWRSFLGWPVLRRLAALSAAAIGVAVVTVAPIALLDPAAFYGDVVVYNVGLKGGDAYPLGGTPGFGFANFLLYFGRVQGLTDLVSFAPAYLLLVPLGLLLLAWQLRHGGPGPVLAAGSVALMLSLYVSRVVHPNYLVLAAVLLPLGLLAGARRAADVAVVPLLLLAWAVELVEAEPLRLVWEDAVSVRLPQHLTGLPALLAPRGGPHLTLDPLGLLFGALAALVAITYATVGLLGAGPRLRLGLVALAAVLVVVAPSVVTARIGAVTGAVRAQDPWAASLSAQPVREMFSSSFRRDPPSWLVPRNPLKWPQVVGARLASIFFMGVAIGFALVATPAGARPLLLGVMLLSPLAAGSVLYGSGVMAAVSLLVAATRWGTLAAGLWIVALGAGLGGLSALLAWQGVALPPVLTMAAAAGVLVVSARVPFGAAHGALLLLCSGWLLGAPVHALAAPLVLLARAAGEDDEGPVAQ